MNCPVELPRPQVTEEREIKYVRNLTYDKVMSLRDRYNKQGYAVVAVTLQKSKEDIF